MAVMVLPAELRLDLVPPIYVYQTPTPSVHASRAVAPPGHPPQPIV
jgi:hypothetical protein